MPDDVDRRIDALFTGPPEEFVAGRDVLARELRKADRARSDEVKALRKPTVAAWALDRAARADPGAVAELRAAGDAVRRAQGAAVARGGGALREATERRRAVRERLADLAVAEAGEAHRDEIETTLEAASVDEAVGELLSAGRLQRTHEPPSGFDDLAGLLAASAPTAGDDDGAAERQREAEAARRRERSAEVEAEVERAAAEVQRAEDELGRAQRALDVARQQLAEAEAERERLAAELH